jgi:hypothetical protein
MFYSPQREKTNSLLNGEISGFQMAIDTPKAIIRSENAFQYFLCNPQTRNKERLLHSIQKKYETYHFIFWNRVNHFIRITPINWFK